MKPLGSIIFRIFSPLKATGFSRVFFSVLVFGLVAGSGAVVRGDSTSYNYVGSAATDSDGTRNWNSGSCTGAVSNITGSTDDGSSATGPMGKTDDLNTLSSPFSNE